MRASVVVLLIASSHSHKRNTPEIHRHIRIHYSKFIINTLPCVTARRRERAQTVAQPDILARFQQVKRTAKVKAL